MTVLPTIYKCAFCGREVWVKDNPIELVMKKQDEGVPNVRFHAERYLVCTKCYREYMQFNQFRDEEFMDAKKREWEKRAQGLAPLE